MESLIEKAKGVGSFFLGLIVLAVFGVIMGLILFGGVWLSNIIYPIAATVSGIAFLISLVILLPLGIFRKTRSVSGQGLLIASYIIGFSLWIWAFLLSYTFWGFLGLIIGLAFFGVGVLPIAMLASLVNGEWSILGQLVLATIVVYGLRTISFYLLESSEKYSNTSINR